MKTRYRATVVDLVPDVSAEQLAEDCSSCGYGATIAEAEERAIENSAVNCWRRVYVQEDSAPYVVVKGPYILRPQRAVTE